MRNFSGHFFCSGRVWSQPRGVNFRAADRRGCICGSTRSRMDHCRFFRESCRGRRLNPMGLVWFSKEDERSPSCAVAGPSRRGRLALASDPWAYRIGPIDWNRANVQGNRRGAASLSSAHFHAGLVQLQNRGLDSCLGCMCGIRLRRLQAAARFEATDGSICNIGTLDTGSIGLRPRRSRCQCAPRYHGLRILRRPTDARSFFGCRGDSTVLDTLFQVVAPSAEYLFQPSCAAETGANYRKKRTYAITTPSNSEPPPGGFFSSTGIPLRIIYSFSY